MAGGFAHITLVDELCRDGDIVDGLATLTPAMKRALMFNLNFVELGAVAPDYPYLCLFDNNAAGWANVMHYWRTLDLVRNAVPLVHEMNYGQKDTWKCMAWLFGYTAHVVTDLTVHPVVNMKVGAYEQNKRAHRVCEMNQDVYIFQKVNKREITAAEYIRDGGIVSCSAPGNRRRLHPAVTRLWAQCLPKVPGTTIQVKPGLAVPTAPAAPDNWHRHYVFNVDNIAEEGGRLLPLTRHLAKDAGLVYPALKGMDRDFIDNLATPEQTSGVLYDEVFRRAQENVKTVWLQLGAALDTGDPACLTPPNGNLDTGRDDSGRMIFWKESA